MTLNEELEAIAEHQRFLAQVAKPPAEGMPVANPRFRQCDTCHFRRQCAPFDGADAFERERAEAERRAMCNACPFEGLPVTVSIRCHFALELAALPTEALAGLMPLLSYGEARDLETVRQWRASMRGIF